MFTVVVYEKKTRKVILCLPLKFQNDTFVEQQSTILHNNYEYQVFANRACFVRGYRWGYLLKSKCMLC